MMSFTASPHLCGSVRLPAARVGVKANTRFTSPTTCVLGTKSKAMEAKAKEEFVPWKEPSRLALAGGWVSLASAAALVAPQGTQAFDNDLIVNLSSSPFSGTVNPIFEALFNSLGIGGAT